MRASQPPPASVDEYIALFPRDVQQVLQKIRATIRKAAPAAQEKIGYGIPTFTLNGNLVHFAAYKRHIGFYPGASAVARFRSELSTYAGGKGTIRFPLGAPIPIELVTRIVKFRVRENSDRAERRKN